MTARHNECLVRTIWNMAHTILRALTARHHGKLRIIWLIRGQSQDGLWTGGWDGGGGGVGVWWVGMRGMPRQSHWRMDALFSFSKAWRRPGWREREGRKKRKLLQPLRQMNINPSAKGQSANVVTEKKKITFCTAGAIWKRGFKSN